jgi:hypothetical protein
MHSQGFGSLMTAMYSSSMHSKTIISIDLSHNYLTIVDASISDSLPFALIDLSYNHIIAYVPPSCDF